MTTIGWIGTGNLGKAIVERLLSQGYQVVLYNRTKKNAASLLDLGDTWCDSPVEVAKQAQLIFLCLTGPQATDTILWSTQTSLKHQLQAHHCIVDISTIAPDMAIELSNRLNEYGTSYLECPVSGGAQGASAGTLAAIIAGPQAVFDKYQTVIQAFTLQVTYVGEAGKAQKLKILNNMAESINLLGAIEVLSTGCKLGLDVATMEQAFMSCRGRSAYMQVALDFLKSNETSHVGLDVRCKDMALATEHIGSLAHLPMSQLAKQLFDTTYGQFGPKGDQCDYFELLTRHN
jgi:3-hydroxyisobutyrate dehydrogenase-like beta-hydroxyacid dehydrogenase